MEVFGEGAGKIKGVGPGIVATLGGIGAAFTMHDTLESDEQGIMLSRGKAKLDRKKLKADFGRTSTRKANRWLVAQAMAHGISEAEAREVRLDRAEYARIYHEGSHFTFFNLRSLRKVGIRDVQSRLPSQRLMLQQGLFVLESEVTWTVTGRGQSAARALLNISTREELAQKVVSSTGASARESIFALDQQNPEARGVFSSGEVFEQVVGRCGQRLLDRYGVELVDYEMQTLDFSEAEVGRHIVFENSDGGTIPPDRVVRPELSVVRPRTG